MGEPTLDTVLAAISALYQPLTLGSVSSTEHRQTRESASSFLSALQSSPIAWKLADELLQHSLYVKPDVEACYFAAHTLRTRIQNNFHELPVVSHQSLRESIIRYLTHLSTNCDQQQVRVIRTQLTISLSRLIILDENWSKPLEELITLLPDRNSLLQVLTYVPEELSECSGARSNLRGVSGTRRKQVTVYLSSISREIVSLLTQLEQELKHDRKQHAAIYRSFSSWIHLIFYSSDDIVSHWKLCQPIIQSIMEVLSDPVNADEDEHDSAVESFCVFINSYFTAPIVIDAVKDVSKGILSQSLFDLICIAGPLVEFVLALESPYSSSQEEIDKSINYMRLFSETAESSLDLLLALVSCDAQDENLQKTKTVLLNMLRLMMMCTSNHFDYDVAEASFDFYHKFADSIYSLLIMSSGQTLSREAAKRIQQLSEEVCHQLIAALKKHATVHEDSTQVLSVGSDFREFRYRVRDLLRDSIFMYGPVKLVSNSLLPSISQAPSLGHSWEKIEVDLFFLSVLVNELVSTEEKQDALVTQIVTSALTLAGLPVHPQIKATACDLLRELQSWLPHHPQLLNPVFTFLLSLIVTNGSQSSNQTTTTLANEASNALGPIVTACFGSNDGDTQVPPSNPETLIPVLCSICSELDAVRNEDSANHLLQSAASLISAMPMDGQLDSSTLRQKQEALVLQFLIPHFRQSDDPIVDLDRMSSLLRSLRLSRPPNSTSPTSPLGQFISSQLWPMIQNILKSHAANSSSERLIERACRTLRFVLRSLRPEFLIEPVANCIWSVYQEHPKHSALLYVASIIVDEFTTTGDEQLAEHLMSMLKAFSLATFTYLTQPPVSLREHPDTIDDFFRLCTRYLQKQPIKFLGEAINANSPIQSSLDLAMASLEVDQREAVSSVGKFLSEFLSSAHDSSRASGDDTIRQLIVTHLAPRLMEKILSACCLQLPSYFIPDLTEVVWALIELDGEASQVWMRNFVETLFQTKSSTPESEKELKESCESLINAKSAKSVAHALRSISKVYR